MFTLRILIILACVSVSAHGASYYVNATTGNDDGPGSLAAPWKTIQKALGTQRTAGDTIHVAAGTYREKLNFKQVGTSGSPITLLCEPETWLTGHVRLTNWTQATSGDVRGNTNYPSIYYADLSASTFDTVISDLSGDFLSGSPQIQIFVDGTWLPAAVNMARFPNGDVRSQTGDVYEFTAATLTSLTDTVNLTQATNFWDGALTVYYRKENDSTYQRRITGWNPATDTISWSSPLIYAVTNSARYFILNNPGVIDEPWDFAVETTTRRLFMMFPQNPANYRVELSVLNDAVYSDGSSHFKVDGLKVRGFYRQGVWFREGENVTLTNCLVIENMRDYTYSMSHMTNSVITHSAYYGRGLTISWGGQNRVSNFLGYGSPVDALTATYYETDTVIENSAFLEAWRDSHPDGFQTYVNPTNITLRSVLWFNIGQHWQAADTYFSKATNCIWAVNHWGGGISMSGTRKNFSNEWSNCTIYSANLTKDMSTGNMGSLYDSIVIPTGSVGSSSATNQGFADRNLFWQWGNPFKLTYYTQNPTTGAAQSANATSLANYQTGSGRDLNSSFADPEFLNAPLRLIAINQANNGHNIFGRLHAADMTGITNGGIVEVNGDGIVRRVTNITATYFEFTPAVETNWFNRTYRFPDGQTRAFWWGGNSNLVWDLRLGSGSPGRAGVWASEPVGSSIHMADYKAGDFDSDGIRDVPEFAGSAPIQIAPLILYDFEGDFTGGIVTNRAGYNYPLRRFGRYSGIETPANATNWITATLVTNGHAVSVGARFSWSYNSGYGTYSKDGRYGGITDMNLGSVSNATFMVWARYLPTEALPQLWTMEHIATLATSGRYTVAGAWNLGRRNFGENPLWPNQTAFDFWLSSDDTTRIQLPFPDEGDLLGATDRMHHYAVVFDAPNGVITAYFDGVECASVNAVLPPIYLDSTARWIGFGCQPHHGASTSRDPWLAESGQPWDEYPNNGWLNATMDNFRLYNQSLTADQIRAVYLSESEAGVPDDPDPPPSETGAPRTTVTKLTVGTIR